MAEETAEQLENSKEHHLKPWQFKKGQSGNPSGKKKGTVSLKKFAQSYIQGLSKEDKLKYMEGLDKKTIWEMAEGKPDTESKIEVTLPKPLLGGQSNGNSNDSTKEATETDEED